jgi:hypothetical protein
MPKEFKVNNSYLRGGKHVYKRDCHFRYFGYFNEISKIKNIILETQSSDLLPIQAEMWGSLG